MQEADRLLWNKSPESLCNSVISIQIQKGLRKALKKIKNMHISTGFPGVKACPLQERAGECEREYEMNVKKTDVQTLGDSQHKFLRKSYKEYMRTGKQCDNVGEGYLLSRPKVCRGFIFSTTSQ